MEKIIKQYSNNLSSLREFIQVVEPALWKKHIDEMKTNRKIIFPMLVAVNEILPEMALSPEEIEKNKPDFKYEIFKKQDSVELKIEDGYKEVFENGMKPFYQLFEQTNHLYKTTLISLISTVEWFYSQLLHEYFNLFPESLSSKEKEFSLNDLKEFNSVEDAKNHLITSKVESILYQSLIDWINYLKDHIKLKMGYLENVKDFLYDSCLRRNLIVHNNGVVNSTYLYKVPSSIKCNERIGSLISVSKEYLLKAIDEFERSFILVALELWKKIEKLDENRGNIILELSYLHLNAERFGISESLCLFGKNDGDLSEKIRLDCLFNYWLSIKLQNRFEEVRNEISKKDIPANDEKYVLAKYILLDDYENVAQLLPLLIKSGKLNKEDLKTLPLFNKIKQEKELVGEKES